MIGLIVLFILIVVEVGLMLFSLMKKSNLKKEKSFIRVGFFLVFIVLVFSPIIDWNFKWFMLGLYFAIQAILGILFITSHKENSNIKKGRIIVSSLNRVLLIFILVLPTLIFPQYKPIEPTGEYTIGTEIYTLTDESREEYFTEEDDYRKVTIQFWYPLEKGNNKEVIKDTKFPLIIFSHGAFGYRMSNYSTFQELASNGYTVCSIDHTYHAFMTNQEDGNRIIGNIEFMNSAMNAQNGVLEAEEIYNLGLQWMDLRTKDMSFVLDYITEMTSKDTSHSAFQTIDIEKIGVLGHSLGGATAAQIGRDNEVVDAVIVLDGTMIGEIVGFEDGKEIISDVPYPKPIMNIYNEEHYKEVLKREDRYANMIASKNALNSYEVMVKDSGHINFTDLPMISPFLSSLLGTGSVDPRYCVETTNDVILQFFNYSLKSSNIELAKERIY